ncbi:tripartite tricarboxylate transporter substrate binding protein [Variovorax sp. J2P1-59]|uniref:Bug family tripartite tricarboxylate transporter substrate binding protein n=1 Tax=Variovorax flavidus TaxID=3053501 RepID=UPI002578006C|nr:tripartite tricarboxylate transporter substrate binding protein [Variovorax sp. J2P1-59]MDM0078751.1 tripartite tricarboxylate transporter substrate binding protein [Variovorax sp. J2P1-59]
MTHRRDFLVAAAAALAAGTSIAQTPYPDRPVRLIVPNPPGGPSDIVARLLSEHMRDSLGQLLIVDNRPGASGLIGTAFVASAPADGYTVLVTSRSNHTMAPLVQKSTQVDPVRDLAPVGLAVRAVGMFVTNSQTGLRSMKDLIAFAKANPGKLNFGSAGIGATNHIAVEQFKALAGIDITHVPYKGSGPLITGVMGNEVQFALLDFASAQVGTKSGSIVPLMQTGAKRLPAVPNVPTLAEGGFKDFDPSFWVGLAVPVKTAPDVVRKLNAALNDALSRTGFKAYAQANGWEVVGGAPKVLGDTVAADMADFPAIIKKLDLRAG